MTARQLMKERPMVLPHTARLRDAARLILEHRFRNVPVVDESGRYLGVVSANRLLQMVLPKAAFMERSAIDSLPFVKDTLADFRERWREVASTPVLECLDTDLETVTPETSIAETLLSLYHNRTSLPVVDATTMRLVGIVSHWSAGAAMAGEGSP